MTRSELLLQSIRMIQVFLAQSPTNPLADEASLALVGAFLELEDFKARREARRRGSPSSIPRAPSSTASSTARPWPTSTWASTTGRSRWPRRSPRPPTRTPPGPTSPARTSGRRSTSWARSSTPAAQPGKALEYYRQVADRFTDAASAIQSYTRKDLKVPEVSVVRPDGQAGRSPQVDPAPRGLRAVGRRAAGCRAGAGPEPPAKPGIKLEYRNIAEADVKVYPVDLMQLYLTRRNLNGIAGIDLAGHHAAGREDRHARRRLGLRRQVPDRSTCR